MRSRSLCLILLVLVSVGAPAVGATTASEKPAVDITIRSTAIDDGDTYETGSDVGMTINASVGDGGADGTELSEIVVRVNGQLDESIQVNGTSVSETVRPELDDGNNSVRVIVTDDAGNVNATTFTVIKDETAPHVYLTAPYQSAPWKPIEDGTTKGSRTTIAGNVIEDSSVEKLQITRSFDGDRSTRVLRDVGDNFSVDMLLGYGENESKPNDFKITVTDRFDNVRLYTFSIDVVDNRGPTISLEPYPNETTSNRIFFAGTVDDDIGVKSANLTLKDPDGNVTGSATIAKERTRKLDADRLSVSFNESLYMLYPGTYEATVSVTDITGKTTTKTVTLERKPQSDRDVAPEIAVDRDRTVVTGPEQLFVSGSVFEGVTTRLVVETRSIATDETLDYQIIHSGSRTQRIDFDREVAIAANNTEVIIRATDAKGIEHTKRFVVNGGTQDTFVGDPTGDAVGRWPRVTVEPLQDDRAGTESSSVTVRRGLADTTVSIPDDDSNEVVSTMNVSVDSLSIDLTADTNVTATVVARERAGDALSAPDGSNPAASITIQHAVAADAVGGATLDLTVRRAYLDAHGIDQSNLSVYRLSGGDWSAIDTSLVESNETHVSYRVDSPGLSVFSLATDPSSTGDGTDDVNETDPGNGTSGNATVANGTAGNETVGNETATNDTGGGAEGGEATIIVSNVTVNSTAVAVNESVMVNATLANKGDAEATYTAGFQTLHGMNVTQVDTKQVTIPPGEERTVDFTTEFATEGNHTVMVNGSQAGPVVVGGGGGGLLSFLSILSFLPLRLIGMALGGIFGLLLVLVLLRFVLGKVGGGGESASG